MTMLIVHSDEFAPEVQALRNQLNSIIEVTAVSTFAEANEICQQAQPDIICSQTKLADGNAFDFCTRVRLLQDQRLTPFIIFTDKADKKERVQTFQVGADEYISDFDVDYIRALIEHEIESNIERQKLETEKEQASHLAMEVMKTSSELGNAINFIERCHRFQSKEEISSEIITFCQSLNLKVVIGVMEDQRWHFQSASGQVAELERDLMQSIHNQDRFVDFGVRTQMNWPNIALLVKNMPLREPETYGRIKDLLPTLLSSANVRIHSLFEEKRIKEQTLLMKRSIEALQPSIEEVIRAMRSDAQRHRASLSDFLQKIIIALPGLGLEDDQEEFFISRVETLISEADQMATRNEGHQDTLEKTNQVLVNLLEKQREIEDLISSPLEIADKHTGEEEELFELF